MESFWIAWNAVVPFFIYFAFGYGIQKTGIVDKPFFIRLNQMIFKAFFPVMMFNNIYRTSGGQEVSGKLLAVNIACVLLLIGASMVAVPLLVKENSRRGVIVQALYRGNCVLFAVPLAENVFGAEGASLASIVLAFIIPIYNVMAVLILEYFRGGKPSLPQLLKKMITNPMIMGAAVGAVFLWLGIRLPACVEKPVKEYAALCTPLACFVMGGTLFFYTEKFKIPGAYSDSQTGFSSGNHCGSIRAFGIFSAGAVCFVFPVCGSGGGCLFLHGSGYGRRRGFGKRDGGGQLLCQRIYDFYVDLCD